MPGAYRTAVGGEGTQMISANAAPTTGSALAVAAARKVVKATVSGTGAVSASIDIYGNVHAVNSGGVKLGTLSPSGTTSAVDGIAFDAPWPFLYAVLTAISGTGAIAIAEVSF